MAFDSTWLKAHWYYIAGGLIGFFVLYEILSKLGGGAAASSSGGMSDAAQVNQLQGGVDVANANYNAQVATAQIAGQVASNQTQAALEASEATTAGEVAVALAQTQASVTNTKTAASVSENASNNAVTTQAIVTGGQVQETGIIGSVLTTLGKQKEDVNLASINLVGQQVGNVQAYSKNAGKDYGALAPIIALETGQGGAATGLAAANAKVATAPTAGTTAINAGANVISGLLAGLFA